jgi:hypothetical protein
MGSLYIAHTNNIQKNCTFTIGETREKIFSLDSNMWVVYSLGTISTNHSSPKARTISSVQIRSGQAVKLQPGCFIRTMDYINMADEAEQVT